MSTAAASLCKWEDNKHTSTCLVGDYKLHVDGRNESACVWYILRQSVNEGNEGNEGNKGNKGNKSNKGNKGGNKGNKSNKSNKDKWVEITHSADVIWRYPENIQQCKEDAELAVNQLLLNGDARLLKGNSPPISCSYCGGRGVVDEPLENICPICLASE